MFAFLKRQLRKPRNDREWSLDLRILPEIVFNEDGTITIKNIRNFVYRSVTDYTPRYYDRTIHVSQIQNVWFMVEPFSLLAAHTLLSFGLSDGTYIAISIEIRKQKNQKFSQWLVLFFLRRHELIYVVGDEHDLIRLRTNHRLDNVYLYPLTLTSQDVQELFLHMLKRAQHIQEQPEFYNPFTNTCLTNIIDHIREVTHTHIPFNYKILIATLADRYAYNIGLINNSLPFKMLKKKHHINTRALQHQEGLGFSKLIREDNLTIDSME